VTHVIDDVTHVIDDVTHVMQISRKLVQDAVVIEKKLPGAGAYLPKVFRMC
jgi:hypothetical protein